jgi:hypothetical protein
MDTRLGTWNLRSMYKAGSLITAVKEISKHKLHFVEVWVRCDRVGTKAAGEYTFFYGKGERK